MNAFDKWHKSEYPEHNPVSIRDATYKAARKVVWDHQQKEIDHLKKQLTTAHELIDWKYNRETNDTCGAMDEQSEKWLDENSSYDKPWNQF